MFVQHAASGSAQQRRVLERAGEVQIVGGVSPIAIAYPGASTSSTAFSGESFSTR